MHKKYLLGLAIFSCALVTQTMAWNAKAPTSSVLIFASFSMPKESLRGWIQDADKIKAPVIMRGLVNNSFRDTTQAVIKLLPNNQGGVQIDPTLFKRFQIQKVPAVVVLDNTCFVSEACQAFSVVYGDVTLSYALKEVARRDTQFVKLVEMVLKRLQGET